MVLYFVDSCSWIVFLKKQRRPLAANHLMKTNFLACFFLVYWFDWFGTPDFQKLCKYFHLRTWCLICVLLISDVLCCCPTCCFHYCDNCCEHTTVSFTHKAFKIYLCNLIEAFFFTTKLDWWHCCIKLLRLPSDVRFVLLQQIYHF